MAASLEWDTYCADAQKRFGGVIVACTVAIANAAQILLGEDLSNLAGVAI
jgi:hypothetical protein